MTISHSTKQRRRKLRVAQAHMSKFRLVPVIFDGALAYHVKHKDMIVPREGLYYRYPHAVERLANVMREEWERYYRLVATVNILF